MNIKMKLGHLIAVFALIFTATSCATQKERVSKERIWEISENTVDCVGVGPQTCLQVREQGTTEWTLFYDQIENFNYQEGYAYTVKIKESNVPNPPADASSKRYELVNILSKRNITADDGGAPLLKGNFTVTTLNGRDVSDKKLTLNVHVKDGKISGYGGCNNYSLKFKQRKYQLRFSQVTATEMYCEDSSSLEKEFLITYIQGDRFTLEEGTLKIYDIDNHILTAQEVQ